MLKIIRYHIVFAVRTFHDFYDFHISSSYSLSLSTALMCCQDTETTWNTSSRTYNAQKYVNVYDIRILLYG